jgi:hypothetical protein
MADFVRQVRELLDRTTKPGRRRWLCVRVPALIVGHDPLGIDVAAMARVGADMFNLSCSYFTVQQTDVRAIRGLVPDAAVYLEMTHTTLLGKPAVGYDSFPFLRTTKPQFYTTAALAYDQGCDGMSLFNFAYYREHGSAGRGPFNEPPFEILEHLADRDWLKRRPPWYFIAAASMPKLMRTHWPLPKAFKPGTTGTFELEMLPEVRPTDDKSRMGVLRLIAEASMPDCAWRIKVNGIALESRAFDRKPIDHPYEGYLGEPEQYACFTCPASVIRAGKNQIEVRLDRGSPVKIVYLDVVFP